MSVREGPEQASPFFLDAAARKSCAPQRTFFIHHSHAADNCRSCVTHPGSSATLASDSLLICHGLTVHL